jgi:uncharacterized membrane protein
VAWFVLSMQEPVRFLAPGTASVEIPSAGRYVIWHEHETVFENRSYRAPAGMPPGARISVRAPDGSALTPDAAGSASWSSGEVQRTAIGGFQASGAGRHAVAVEGDFPPRVISVAREFFLSLAAVIGGAILSALVGLCGGMALAVYAVVRRYEAAAPPRDPAALPAPDSERALRDMVAVVYALQAASFLVGVTLIAGVVIDYLKRDEVAGTWLESHVRWQISTFWWSLAWALIGLLTAILLVGFVILLVTAAWLIYRIAKGWIALGEKRPVS